MIELLYVSRAQEHFSKSQLTDLLKLSRRNNSNTGITGLLLYDGKGTFIQALEGDADQVTALFDTISKDERHSRVNRISCRKIEVCSFSEWSMGFSVIDDQSIRKLPGFSDFMMKDNDLTAMDDKGSPAIELLNYFKLHENQRLIEG